MSEDRILVKGGTVVSMDPSIGRLDKGDVLIVGNKIREVAAEIEAKDCTVIDASGSIVIPGLIDTHKHMWQTVLRGVYSDWGMMDYGLMVRTIYPVCFEPEDAYISNYAGALEAIDAGVTTVVDHSHLQTSPDTTDALIQGTLDAGLGGFYCYGMYNNPTYTAGGPIDIEKTRGQVNGIAEDWHYENAARAKEKFFNKSDQALRFGVSTSEFLGNPSIDEIEQEMKAIEKLEPELITWHGGAFAPTENLASRPPGPPWIREMDERNLFHENMIFSHLTLLCDEEFEILARNGVAISTTPFTELNSGPFDLVLDPARRNGMKGSLGSDTCVMSPADMFSQARTALLVDRNARMQAAGFGGPHNLPAKEYLGVLTCEAAEAVGRGDELGSLTPGKQADVVILSTNALNMAPVNDVIGAIIFQASSRDVDTVIINGEIRKQNGQLVGVDTADVRDRLTKAQARISKKLAKIDVKNVMPVWAAGGIWEMASSA